MICLESLVSQNQTPPDFAGRNDISQTTPSDTSSKRNSFLDIFTGKPGKAAFYSLIIPGGGQFYNKRYWKVPLIVGGEAAAFWWLIRNSNLYSQWQTAYVQLLDEEIDSYNGVSDPIRAKLIRDGYLKQKEYGYIIVILAHLFNVFEAFIDRHLIDFDVSDDLSFVPRIGPTIGHATPPGISFTWNLNKKKNNQLKPKDFFGSMAQ